MNPMQDLLDQYNGNNQNRATTRLLGQILTNPVGTESIGPEAREATSLAPKQSLGDFVRTDPTLQLGLGFSPGIIAGRGAATAPKATLDWARELMSEGHTSPQEIWQTTGWMQGSDNKWRFEIPDTNAQLKPGAFAENQFNAAAKRGNPNSTDLFKLARNPDNSDLRLSDVLDHPGLYSAYPHLADTPIVPTGMFDSMRGVKGAYFPPGGAQAWPAPGSIALSGSTMADMRSTLLHEIQHAVQHEEGFERGGNSEEFLPAGHETFKKDLQAKRVELQNDLRGYGIDINDAVLAAKFPSSSTPALQEAQSLLQNPGSDLLPRIQDYIKHERLIQQAEQHAYEQYRSLAGETEARNVQARANLKPYDLSVMYPGATADVPESAQLLKYRDAALQDPEARKHLLELRLQGYDPVPGAPNGELHFRRNTGATP